MSLYIAQEILSQLTQVQFWSISTGSNKVVPDLGLCKREQSSICPRQPRLGTAVTLCRSKPAPGPCGVGHRSLLWWKECPGHAGCTI